MNKILRLVCQQADFKKIVSIGFFAAFLAVFLSAGTAQASFLDWFNLNKANNDSQQAAAVTKTKATSTAAAIKVISPNGGEVWKAGTKKDIKFKGNLTNEVVHLNLEWGGKSGGNVFIGVFIGESVALGTGKTSTYSWTIPATIEQRNDYKISARYPNVAPVDNEPAVKSAVDSSDKPFTIKNASNSSSSRSKSSRSRSSKSSSSRSSRSSATTTPSNA